MHIRGETTRDHNVFDSVINQILLDGLCGMSRTRVPDENFSRCVNNRWEDMINPVLDEFLVNPGYCIFADIGTANSFKFHAGSICFLDDKDG